MKKIRLSFQGSLLAGGVLFGLIVLLGLLAPWVAPHDPLQVDLLNRLAPPSRKYPFGTDHLGRDVLSRLIYGIRTSVLIACAITVATLCFSLPIGLLIGYVRGRVDQLIMRGIDGVLAFPDIILTVAIVGILGPGFVNMTLAIIAVRWAGYVRYIRSLVQKSLSGGLRSVCPFIRQFTRTYTETLCIATSVAAVVGLCGMGYRTRGADDRWAVLSWTGCTAAQARVGRDAA